VMWIMHKDSHASVNRGIGRNDRGKKKRDDTTRHNSP
jgi:hypothetical protein